MNFTIADEPLPNPHRHLSEVHYRLYLTDTGPVAVCVQDFDYHDYDTARFLTETAHDSKDEAHLAIRELATARLSAPDFAPDQAQRLARAGVPLTRQQALDALLA